MLKFIKIILISIALIVTVLFLSAATKQSNKTQEPDYSNFLNENSNLQFTFLFPINDDKIQLKVVIPKDFKPLQGDPNSEILEFIPKTDKDPYKWTEIITLNKILGTGITAPDYIESLDNMFVKSGVKDAKILETEKHSFDGYQDASSIIKYNANGRDEVVIFYSVSGRYDIANIQYALPLASQNDLDKTVQKLKDFIKNNTDVIKSK